MERFCKDLGCNKLTGWIISPSSFYQHHADHSLDGKQILNAFMQLTTPKIWNIFFYIVQYNARNILQTNQHRKALLSTSSSRIFLNIATTKEDKISPFAARVVEKRLKNTLKSEFYFLLVWGGIIGLPLFYFIIQQKMWTARLNVFLVRPTLSMQIQPLSRLWVKAIFFLNDVSLMLLCYPRNF